MGPGRSSYSLLAAALGSRPWRGQGLAAMRLFSSVLYGAQQATQDEAEFDFDLDQREVSSSPRREYGHGSSSLKRQSQWSPTAHRSKLADKLLNPIDLVKEAEDDLLDSEQKNSLGPHLVTLPRLSRIIGPLRSGELTVFSGPTGCGKTTVLSQMSLEYSSQGIGTLWGSFEIKNARLARVMLQQISKKPLLVDSATGTWTAEAEDELSRARTVFSRLPLLFMPFHGSTPIEEILFLIRKACGSGAKRPLQHVILDNLQFMLACPNGRHSALDKWDQSDRILSDLRALATETGLHVTLVIHPRKELDDTWLGLASVSGTAKATQEADNVLILQKIQDKRYLEVKKNRFSGDLGRVRIGFDQVSRKVFEIEASDAEGEKGRPAEGVAEGL